MVPKVQMRGVLHRARARSEATMSTAKPTPEKSKRVRAPKEPAEHDLALEDLRDALRALKAGDFSVRIPPGNRRMTREVAAAFNDVAAMLEVTSAEFVRVSKVVGRDGEMMERAQLKGAQGGWSSQVESFNALIGDLVRPSTEVARVIIAVAAGDLSQKMALEIEGKPVRGEFLRISTSVNTMVDQLRSFASEVTRVAKEVGIEGKLGGQAEVTMSGTWKHVTENVNLLAGNLTAQVRNIALVTTAVANGDLTQKIDVVAKGELLELKSTVNKMVDQLSAFASEVTRVAKEVGVEGKLGGQAKVPGAAGTWRDLTDNVNQLANNLTSQVRAIMEVSIAVTQGDLTRSISVEAQGELLALRGNLNQMIANLRDTTQHNQAQDWLKTNLAKFSGMMQGQKTLDAVSRLIMSELTPLVSAHHGAFFIASETAGGDPPGHHGRGCALCRCARVQPSPPSELCPCPPRSNDRARQSRAPIHCAARSRCRGWPARAHRSMPSSGTGRRRAQAPCRRREFQRRTSPAT